MKKMFLALVVAGMAIASFQTAKASECVTNEITCANAYVAGGSVTITKCNGCEEVNVSDAGVDGCCTN